MVKNYYKPLEQETNTKEKGAKIAEISNLDRKKKKQVHQKLEARS